jgi:hypothetical protein
MNNRLEDNLQIACVRYFRLQYPQYLIFAFPAGFMFAGDETKRARTGKRMKEMGYCVGTPDIHIPVPNRFYHGMYIEMKVKPNKPTDNQLSVMKELEKCGYKCVVCYSIESFMEEVNRYFDFL